MSKELKEALAPFAIAIQPHVPGDQMMKLIGHTADDYRRALAAYETLSHLPDREEVARVLAEELSGPPDLFPGAKEAHRQDQLRAADRILSLMERKA